jgi:hypothetical protein
MYENQNMRPGGAIPGMREWIMENDEEFEFNYDLL